MVGVGYRARMQGRRMMRTGGKRHDVIRAIPKGIAVKQTVVHCTGRCCRRARPRATQNTTRAPGRGIRASMGHGAKWTNGPQNSRADAARSCSADLKPRPQSVCQCLLCIPFAQGGIAVREGAIQLRKTAGKLRKIAVL